MKKRLLLFSAVIFFFLAIINHYHTHHAPDVDNQAKTGPVTGLTQKSTTGSDDAIANAFANHESNIQISGTGEVVRLLKDDNKGIRHQRFIIKLSSGQTLLVAHNIDIAGRIEGLSTGDRVSFSGVYEWNDKGGVIHWTHSDPSGRHTAGWIEYNDRRYQ
jgi:hypothetical protein